MKRFDILLLSMTLALSLCACGGRTAVSDGNGDGGDGQSSSHVSGSSGEPERDGDSGKAQDDGNAPDSGNVPDNGNAETVSITLWSDSPGDWSDSDTARSLIAGFQADNPGVQVTVETPDSGVSVPDLVFGELDSLETAWSARGSLLELSSFWEDGDRAEIYPAVQRLCFRPDGSCHVYPLCMTVQCMAVNLDHLKAAGAERYVDGQTHTWTTEAFVQVVNALYEAGNPSVAVVCAAGRGGDESGYLATRALVENLYGGAAETARALALLNDLEGLDIDATLVSSDETMLFRQGVLDMAFCWDVDQQRDARNNDAGLTDAGDEILYLSFPSETGESALPGSVWGFGVLDNGDPARVDAAKTFIRYMAGGDGVPDAVRASGCFPVRDSAAGRDLTGLYADDPILNGYADLTRFFDAGAQNHTLADSEKAEIRNAWWVMLQQTSFSGDISAAVAEFETVSNTLEQ